MPKSAVLGLLLPLLLAAGPRAQAPATTLPARADSAWAALNAVYWNAAGGHYFKTDLKTGRLDFWMSASAWETALEAWQRTGRDADRKRITDLYDGFVRYFGSDWTSNDYNDDIMWWTLACARVYEATGEKRYLDQARKHFDWVWSTQRDTVFGGGIWWRNDEHLTKNSCIVQPAIIAAMYLSRIHAPVDKALSDGYRAKAETLYDWQQRTLTETSGKVYDAINFNGLQKGSTTYNQGTFIGAANLLGRTLEAEKAMDWTKANLADGNGILRNTTQGDFGTFAQIFIRYAVRMARTPGGARYLPWMEANAAAAWKNRRIRDHITGFNWAAAAPDTTIQCQSAFGGVTLLNLLATGPTTAVRRGPLLAPSPGGPPAWRIAGFRLDGRRAPAPGPASTGVARFLQRRD